MSGTMIGVKRMDAFLRLARLALLALVASLLVVLAAKPAHANEVFTVNVTGDLDDKNIGDGVCDVDFAIGNACTLRAAIEEANATPGLDLIHFNIPDAFGAGVKTISPAKGLPRINEQVTIDGYTQPGSSPNTLAKGTNAKPMIELDGTTTNSDPFGNDGLFISDDAPNTIIRGLVINRFGGNGIFICCSGTSSGAQIEGNFIGSDPSGTQDLGNGGHGVHIVADGTTVGGSLPQARNLISGNDSSGVSLGAARLNGVSGNLIGTNKDGTGALGNSRAGVVIFASSNNSVGGSSAASANTIAFNGSEGVEIEEPSSDRKSNGDRVQRNSIFSNGSLGIAMGHSLISNDSGDADTGANNLQNFPEITSAKKTRKGTTVKGTLNSTANVFFTVQLFSNPEKDPSGFGEGKTFLGETSVSTDGNGNAFFTFKTKKKVPKGQFITATATKNVTSDTSEFSAAKQVA